jgi:hypothetical protein
MWPSAYVRQATAGAGMALALFGTVSCASGSGAQGMRAAVSSRECAPHSAQRSHGLAILPVSSAQNVGYCGAQYAWAVSNTASGDVGGAGQGAWLQLAVTDLQLGLIRDMRTTTLRGRQAYRMAVRELRQMASLPDTDLTPQQQAEYEADVVRLNRFFGTKVPV